MKNSYILLRNNIESSSLLIEDLQKIGIQSTDLFWVECQSVCWQRPTEIEELKNLVQVENAKLVTSNLNEALKTNVEIFEPNVSKIKNNKLVFVELPAVENKNDTKIKSDKIRDTVLNNMNIYGNPDKKIIKITPKSDLSFDDLNKKTIPSASKSEEMEKTIFGIELPRNIKKIALYTCFIAAGAILMLLIMSNDRKNKIVFQSVLETQPQNVATVNIVEPIEEESIVPISEDFDQTEFIPQTETENSKIFKKIIASTSNDNTPAKRKIEKKEIEKSNIEKKLISKEPIEDLRETKKVAVENISSKLILKASDYEIGSFGGIKNLEMTLENNSEYLLDKITVEINYFNPEKNIVNAENIYFQAINPGETVTIPVKKSKRGVKIGFKIIKIESKEIAIKN